MKKFLLSLLLALTIIMPSNVFAESNNKITIYLFRGARCGHCESALEYINSNRDKLKDYEFITYETWDDSNNSKLLEKIGKKLELDEDDLGSVPLFVVGDKYIVGYRNSTTIDTVVGNAESFQNAEEYKDIVKEAMEELKQEDSNLKFTSMTLEDIFPEPNPVVNIIIYSVFGILVIGFIAMIAFSRKK